MNNIYLFISFNYKHSYILKKLFTICKFSIPDHPMKKRVHHIEVSVVVEHGRELPSYYWILLNQTPLRKGLYWSSRDELSC